MRSTPRRVFERGDDGQWVQRVELIPPADGEIRGAGTAVALSGDAVFLGAPSDAGPGAVATGTSPTATLALDGGRGGDAFATSLTASGASVLIGAPGAAQAG